jgi:hypothetical protein
MVVYSGGQKELKISTLYAESGSWSFTRMRASRAYIAGFGTTSILVASSLLLLAVVSALVAFRGWPDTGFTENISSLVVDEPQRVEVDGPVQVAQNASPAAAAVGISPVPGTAAAGSLGARTLSAGRAGATSGVVVPTGPRGRDPDGGDNVPGNQRGTDRDTGARDPVPSSRRANGLLPETPLTPQVNRVTQGLGDTTQGLTDNLGGSVGQLSPQLGKAVTDTGRILAELVRSLGRPRQ